MRRDTQAVLLLLVGGTLLKISIAGTYTRYVKPGQLWLLLLGGTVLVAVAAVTLYRQLRAAMPAVGSHRETSQRVRAEAAAHAAAAHEGLAEEPATTDTAGAEPVEEDHHDHDRSRIGWLLLVPALALLIFSPPALGSFSANRNGTALGAASTSDFAPLAAGDPVRVTLLDYAGRAVFDHGASLQGRTVLLTGFVIAGPRGEPYLARLFVGCCAADARPVKVGLTGDLPPDLTSDQWLEVTGTYTPQFDKDQVNGEIIPYLSAVSVQVIGAPEEQYES